MDDFVTDEDFEDALKMAKVYADASYADSDEDSIEALRCAVYQLIACLKIRHIQSSEQAPKERK